MHGVGGNDGGSCSALGGGDRGAVCSSRSCYRADNSCDQGAFPLPSSRRPTDSPCSSAGDTGGTISAKDGKREEKAGTHESTSGETQRRPSVGSRDPAFTRVLVRRGLQRGLPECEEQQSVSTVRYTDLLCDFFCVYHLANASLISVSASLSMPPKTTSRLPFKTAPILEPQPEPQVRETPLKLERRHLESRTRHSSPQAPRLPTTPWHTPPRPTSALVRAHPPRSVSDEAPRPSLRRFRPSRSLDDRKRRSSFDGDESCTNPGREGTRRALVGGRGSAGGGLGNVGEVGVVDGGEVDSLAGSATCSPALLVLMRCRSLRSLLLLRLERLVRGPGNAGARGQSERRRPSSSAFGLSWWCPFWKGGSKGGLGRSRCCWRRKTAETRGSGSGRN